MALKTPRSARIASIDEASVNVPLYRADKSPIETPATGKGLLWPTFAVPLTLLTVTQRLVSLANGLTDCRIGRRVQIVFGDKKEQRSLRFVYVGVLNSSALRFNLAKLINTAIIVEQ